MNLEISSHRDLCVFHAPVDSKNPDSFNHALNDKITKEESDTDIAETDLTGVVFPAGADFRGRVFQKAIRFNEARFIRGADFGGAQFAGAAYFGDAQFDGRADFTDAHFHGAANFRYAHFGRVADFRDAHFDGAADLRYAHFDRLGDFMGARFGGEANFGDAHFGGAAYFQNAHFDGSADLRYAHFGRSAYFWGARFGGEASFRSAQFDGAANFIGTAFPTKDGGALVVFQELAPESAARVRFEGVDLSRVSFLRTDVSQVQFVGCTWAEKPASLLWPFPIPRPRQTRTVIYDEVPLDEEGTGGADPGERRLVALLYRQLRLNYEASRQEVEAGHFYIGQMKMRRQDPSYPWPYRGLLAAYRVLAMYGESYMRPPFFYFLFAMVFALAYLWGGFQVGQAQVKYQWLDWDWGNTAPFLQHFVRAYVQALTAGGLLGTNLTGLPGASLETTTWWVPAVRYVNMLLDTFLVGFFVIALRRHFHR